MTSASHGPADYIPAIKALQQAAECGDNAGFYAALNELTVLHESNLFRDVGRLTRQLHDAMSSFKLDSQVAELASEAVPDARDRLDEVIRMTDQSAHRTMDLIEASIPSMDALLSVSDLRLAQWREIQADGMADRDVSKLAGETLDFIGTARETSAYVRQQLSEVVIAQNFQDLSGQVIRKVIGLLKEVESTLVSIIDLSGQGTVARTSQDGAKPASRKPDEDRLNNQGEVDDVLSSLGF